jgi:hypothetical protein
VTKFVDFNENEDEKYIHPFLMASQYRWKCCYSWDLENGSYAIGHHMVSNGIFLTINICNYKS